MASFLRKNTIVWSRELRRILISILERDAIPQVKDIILGDYGFSLNDVANPKSKLAPDNYMSSFSKKLNGFDYIKETANGLYFVTPDMENFDFRDGLEPVLNILEGLSGRYVEVDRADYKRVTGMQTYRGQMADVYLVKYTGEVRNWEKELDKKFEEYAFSNTPPIDIFGRAEKFVSENMGKWIDEAIEKSQKEFKV